jgi:hypothetical protein
MARYPADMRVVLVVAALALLAPVSAAVVAPAGAGTSAVGDDNTTATANATAGNGSAVPPGARLAGVVGSQGARIDGEFDERSFSVRLERANTTGARAAVVADTVNATNATVADLRERLGELRAAREAGNISEGAYRARVAVVSGRIDATRGLANASAAAARDLPDAALRERGVTPAAVRGLRANAAELGGPEVAALARNVTGRPAGVAGRGPPGANGTVPGNAGPANPGNRSGARNATVPGGGLVGNGSLGTNATGGSDDAAGNGSADGAVPGSENGSPDGTSGVVPGDVPGGSGDTGGSDSPDTPGVPEAPGGDDRGDAGGDDRGTGAPP